MQKRPKDVPSAPNIVYKNQGWEKWKVFLGVQAKDPSKSGKGKRAGGKSKGKGKGKAKQEVAAASTGSFDASGDGGKKRKREVEGAIEHENDSKRHRGVEDMITPFGGSENSVSI